MPPVLVSNSVWGEARAHAPARGPGVGVGVGLGVGEAVGVGVGGRGVAVGLGEGGAPRQLETARARKTSRVSPHRCLRMELAPVEPGGSTRGRPILPGAARRAMGPDDSLYTCMPRS